MKRAPTTEGEPVNKQLRYVEYGTFSKWRRELDREHETMLWLCCSSEKKDKKTLVTQLTCKVCTENEDKICGTKNFSNKWIYGADCIKISNVRDHAKSEQHAKAMSIFKKKRAAAAGVSPLVFSPITRSLNKLSNDERAKLKVKFDNAYFVATERLPFTKYPQICELESHHGVSLGRSYTNDNAGKEFVHYIADTRRQAIRQKLENAIFFSLLLDGTADTANIENELIIAVWCDKNGSDEKVHTKVDYLTLVRPQSVSGQGLFKALESGLQILGIDQILPEQCAKLVGVGTDGASANLAAAGLKGLVEKQLPWVFWNWCLAHRLELAIKGALKGSTFDLIDELLLQLYYLYERSPKRCRELEDIIADLKLCFSFDDGGVRPIRSNGTRWVSHKQNAMKRVLSKFGAYTSHLASLSEDKSVNSVDRAKLRGYYRKWTDAKYLLGCSLFVDLLKPCEIFSKSMQSDEIDILGALNTLLKTKREIDKLGSTPLDQWPTYAATCALCEDDEGDVTYQCQTLKKFSEAQTLYSSKYQEYCSTVSDHIVSRLSWSDMQLMRDIIIMLSSHGWEKLVLEDDDLSVIERLTERFLIPLQSANVNIKEIKSEYAAMIEYATEFIAISSLDYHSVWWRLFHASNSASWSNVLKLALCTEHCILHILLPSSQFDH